MPCTYCQWVVFKRLIVGGFEGVYEFSKISVTKEWTEHTTQFTAMEIYVAYKDYNWMMKCRRPFRVCAVAVNGTSEATFANIK
jgi:lysyl-tRNA synthetase class 2